MHCSVVSHWHIHSDKSLRFTFGTVQTDLNRNQCAEYICECGKLTNVERSTGTYAKGQTGGTFLAEADGRFHLSHELVHLRVIDSAGGVRIALGPDANVFVEVVRPENRRVARQVYDPMNTV